MRSIEQPELITPRLRLKPFDLADAPDVFHYARDPDVSKWTTWRPHNSVVDAEAYIDRVLARPADEYCWAVRLRDEARVIGAIEVGPCQQPTAGIHYVLAKSHWNRGLMTEAFAAVMTWTFTNFPGIQRIRTSAVAENVGSRRVMEKNGLSFENFQTDRWEKCDEPVTQAVYAITRSEWSTRTNRQSRSSTKA